ncbi:MAG TPA: NAD-dependent epimerase/dehydratase family protein [Anaerolineaceae bacterium]|nr:NAD-dependent epimerase/dehydratase family protein [Anaerolineaceae bacterium]
MATYLVTGAAGFIGSRVIHLLIADGHQVIGIDNLNDAYDVRMKQYRLELLKPLAGFTFFQEDILNRAAMTDIFKKHGPIQAVIHLAARAGVRAAAENPYIYLETNSNGTLNLLELCRHYDVPKFLMASTSSIYGGNPPIPTTEEADSSHPLQPYAASKKAAEVMAYTYHHLYKLDISIVRYFTVYGPAPRPDMVMFRFAQWVFEGRTVRITGDGSQSRGFTYLDDIARGTILALKPLGYEIINLGGHQVISINDLLAMIEKLSGKTAQREYIEFHPADVMENFANVNKARSLLGWQPKFTLEEGVANLVDWYRAQRSWASQILTP